MFGKATFALLIIALMIPGGLLSVLAALAGHKYAPLALLVLWGLALGSIISLIWLRTGHVVLKADRLVEYTCLNFSRIFTYAQIFEVKRGTHADQTWVRYYPIGKNGQIDYERVRGTNLVSVYRESELRYELRQRITALPPAFPQRVSSIWILLLLGILLMSAIAGALFLFGKIS